MVNEMLIPSIMKDVIIFLLNRLVLAPLYLCFQVDHPDEVVGIMAMAPAKTTTVDASVKQAGDKIRWRI